MKSSGASGCGHGRARDSTIVKPSNASGGGRGRLRRLLMFLLSYHNESIRSPRRPSRLRPGGGARYRTLPEVPGGPEQAPCSTVADSRPNRRSPPRVDPRRERGHDDSRQGAPDGRPRVRQRRTRDAGLQGALRGVGGIVRADRRAMVERPPPPPPPPPLPRPSGARGSL